jgi:hypothetical protein
MQLLNTYDVIPLFISERPNTGITEVTMPRIGLVETWFQDVDAGWTRHLLDSYQIPFTVLHPGDIKTTDLPGNFDILLLPDNNKTQLMEGKNTRDENSVMVADYPPEYKKGMGNEGLNSILSFLNNGGLIISWGESTSLFTGNLILKTDKAEQEEFRLPFSNTGEILSKAGLYVPGSLVRVEMIKGHPLTYGMQPDVNVFYRGRTAFSTSIPAFDTDRRVIGKFPQRNILQSGYIENENLLSGKSALVWIKKGNGQLVLMAISPAFRASNQAAWKLLFNAILIKPNK